MKVFKDECGSEITDEFYDYFEVKYGPYVRQILLQMREDMMAGTNALAIMDQVYSRLWTGRLMFQYSSTDITHQEVSP